MEAVFICKVKFILFVDLLWKFDDRILVIFIYSKYIEFFNKMIKIYNYLTYSYNSILYSKSLVYFKFILDWYLNFKY